MRQIEVINQETIIDVSAEVTNVEILVTNYDDDLVEKFALEAQQAAIAAEASAMAASESADEAAQDADVATNQALLASAARLNAQNAANAAEASEDAAALSAASALASATSAELDAIATAADRVQTGLDRQATGADRVQTGLDRVATGADRVQTGIDANTATTQAGVATTQAGIATTQAGIATTQAGNALTSANNALNSANAAAASAASAAQVGTSTLLTGFSTGANTTIAGTDTILQAFQKAQGQINARVSGTGVAGQVAFWSGTGSQTGSNNLFWDNPNNRLGINRSVPTTTLDVNGQITSVSIQLLDTIGTGVAINPSVNISGTLFTQFINAGQARPFIFRVGGVNAFSIFASGNSAFNTTTDAGFRLDVNGTARVQGALTLTSNLILPTVTGTRIGTATNQLISFWNKTPIVQPTTSIAAATLAGSGGSTITSGNTFGGYTIQQIAQALINIGILA
jgi:hypothetical protein